jgi:hypothetical protein
MMASQSRSRTPGRSQSPRLRSRLNLSIPDCDKVAVQIALLSGDKEDFVVNKKWFLNTFFTKHPRGWVYDEANSKLLGPDGALERYKTFEQQLEFVGQSFTVLQYVRVDEGSCVAANRLREESKRVEAANALDREAGVDAINARSRRCLAQMHDGLRWRNASDAAQQEAASTSAAGSPSGPCGKAPGADDGDVPTSSEPATERKVLERSDLETRGEAATP